MIRGCSNGHAVDEDYLKACPRCGAALPPPTERAPSLAPEREAVAVPRTGPFVVGGLVLLAFGALLHAGAEEGPALAFSWVLMAVGVLVVLAGVADGLRRRRAR